MQTNGDFHSFKSHYGPWALITGASSGIGEEFANQLARKGLNLVLAARRKQVLDKNAASLREKFGIHVRTVEVDLVANDFLKPIIAATEDIEVGMLVNNAGAELHGAFLKTELAHEKNLIKLNVIAPMELAHHFGQEMAQRGKGGVLFVASGLAYQPVPYFANYAATKAYILSLSESLHYEFKKKGIDVTVVSPGMTNTAMPQQMEKTMDLAKLPMKLMETEPVVEAALDALGMKAAVVPGGMNNVFKFLNTRVLPRQASAAMFGGMMKKAIRPELV